MARRKPAVLAVSSQSILDQHETLRVKRVSKLLDIPERTIWLLLKRGVLRAARPTPKLTLVYTSSIREFLAGAAS
jgi:hypothetical protein